MLKVTFIDKTNILSQNFEARQACIKNPAYFTYNIYTTTTINITVKRINTAQKEQFFACICLHSLANHTHTHTCKIKDTEQCRRSQVAIATVGHGNDNKQLELIQLIRNNACH